MSPIFNVGSLKIQKNIPAIEMIAIIMIRSI